jgi:hypothetical protein
MLATAHGNGPYRPVIWYRGRAYPVAEVFAELGEAVAKAQEIAEGIREEMRVRPEG